MIQQGHGELSLMLFTLLLPMAVSITTIGLFASGSRVFPLVSLILSTAGMIASVVHLAKPLRAPFSILNWRSSWLSREILAVALFWGVVLLWFVASFAEIWLAAEGMSSGSAHIRLIALLLNVAAVLIGIVLLFVIGRAYRIHSRPSWDGTENYFELFAVALGAGLAAGALLGIITQTGSPLWSAVVGLVLSLLLTQFASRSRLQRLHTLFVEDAKLNVALSLENYRGQLSKVTASSILQGIAVILAVMSLGFPFQVVTVTAWTIISVLEISAHFLIRQVFYSLPIQVRHVPRWR